MNLNKVVLLIVISMVLLMAAAPALANQECFSSQAGTSLTVTLTADGIWEQRTVYGWSITKTAEPETLTLARGETGSISYTITASRTPLETEEVCRVSGIITVNNTGDRATEGLKLNPQVQYSIPGQGFQDLSGASVTIIPSAPIPAGCSREYTYLIPFTPVAGANAYRVCSNVTITNHSGHLGEDFGPGEKDGFELPGSPVNKEIDAAASITDQLQGAVPAGFAAEYLTRTWNLPPDTSPFSYTLSISNISAEHGSSFALTNCATLTTCDSKSEQKVTATVTLLTPDVPDEPDEPDVPDEPDEPDEPDVPDEPDEPGEPEKPKPKPLPRTGGGAAVLMLFGLCSLGAGALLLKRKKR